MCCEVTDDEGVKTSDDNLLDRQDEVDEPDTRRLVSCCVPVRGIPTTVTDALDVNTHLP